LCKTGEGKRKFHAQQIISILHGCGIRRDAQDIGCSICRIMAAFVLQAKGKSQKSAAVFKMNINPVKRVGFTRVTIKYAFEKISRIIKRSAGFLICKFGNFAPDHCLSCEGYRPIVKLFFVFEDSGSLRISRNFFIKMSAPRVVAAGIRIGTADMGQFNMEYGIMAGGVPGLAIGLNEIFNQLSGAFMSQTSHIVALHAGHRFSMFLPGIWQLYLVYQDGLLCPCRYPRLPHRP